MNNRFVVTAVRWLGFAAFFLCAFVLFAYLTFPYDRLRESMIAAIEAPHVGPNGQLQPSNMQISIGKLGPTFPFGLKATDVTITFLPTKPTDITTTMKIDSMTIKPGLFALIGRRLDADIDLQGIGGSVQGHINFAFAGVRPGVRDATFKLDHVTVGQVAPLVSMVGLPLFGSMSGNIEFHAPEGRLDQASGEVKLSIAGFKIGDNKAQYPVPGFSTGLTIAQINAGALTAQIKIKDGSAAFERVSSRSDEFQFVMDGKLDLRPNFSDSMMAAGVRFVLTDKYRDKNEQAGNIMMVLTNSAALTAAKRTDNMWGFRCAGAVRLLRCPPDPRGGTAAPNAAPPRRGFNP